MGTQELIKLARETASRHGVPQGIFLSQMKTESNFNPNAVSPVGAEGIGQLMPATAKELGVQNPFDPAQNLDGAARYLRQQIDRFGGNVEKGVAAYNAGAGNVEKYGGVPPFEETRNYVKKVLGGAAAFSDDAAGMTGGRAPFAQPSAPVSTAAPQASSGDPLQEFTSKLLAGFTSQGSSRSQPELPALGSASPSIESEVRRRAIEDIVTGGFWGGQGGFGSGGFGALPEALAANNIAPLERPGSGMRMAGQSLDARSFNPTDALPGLLAGLFAPAAARKPAAAAAAPAATAAVGSGGSWDQGPAIAASHPETGSGYTIPGARDANNRPVVFGRSAANAFAAMVRDSGGLVKPSDIASAQRSESKNAAVGGAVGSMHLGGNAMDIHGASHDWIEKNGARYGWHLHRYGGAGDHGGHFEFRG